MNCKSCTPENIQSVNELLVKVDSFLYCTYFEDYRFHKLGVGEASDIQNRLNHLRSTLQRQYDLLLKGIEPRVKDMNGLTSRIKYYTGIKCCDDQLEILTIDESGLPAWEKSNPFCVPLEVWEQYAKEIFKIQGLDIEITEQLCKLAIQIETEQVSCEIVPTLEALIEACKTPTPILEVTIEECKLTVDLINETSKCKLDVQLCTELLKCGINLTLISQVYDMGGEFKLDDGKTYLCINEVLIEL